MQAVRDICGWRGGPDGNPVDIDASLGAMLAPYRAAGVESTRCAGPRFGLAATADAPVRQGEWCLASAGRPVAPAGMDAWLQEYARRGPDALEQIHGQFAIAVVEPDGGLLLATDRLGACPLWYEELDGGIAFASDPRCLDRHPSARAEIDPQSLFHYLYFGMVPAPGSTRKGRRRLVPGEYLRVRDGQTRNGRYWELAFDESDSADVPALEAELWQTLRDSVRSAVEQGGRTAAFLSGGVDSSTVVGLLAEIEGKDATCYTIAFDQEGYNELGFARSAAQHFGVRHRDYTVTPRDVLEAIPLIAQAYGEPFGNESAVPTYFCARLAREEGIDSLLAGDGGDELFGGNERYVKQQVFESYFSVPGAFRSLLEPLVLGFPGGARIWPVRKAQSYIRQANLGLPARLDAYSHVERAGVQEMFEPAFLERVDSSGPRAGRQAEWDRSHGASTLNRMLHLDMKFTLADNDLRKVTRMCEVAGVEVRYPLLSDELVAFAARLPSDQKVRGKRLRHFFKHAMRDFLPHGTLTKTKHGFGLPFGIWLQSDAPLQALAAESLDGLRGRGILRSAYLDRVTRAHRDEHAVYYGVAIWGLVMLEQWFRAHVDRAGSGEDR